MGTIFRLMTEMERVRDMRELNRKYLDSYTTVGVSRITYDRKKKKSRHYRNGDHSII